VGGLEDLYQQLILDHYRNQRGAGTLARPSVAVEQHNPLCGDEVRVEMRIEDGRVAELAHTGQGCSISQASTSMMSEAMAGRTIDEALALVEHFRLMMHGSEAPDEERLGDAVALEGVARYPVRIKCALLGWMAAKDAIQTYGADGEG
jgi:nitrogen fixation protein NifU and related proteins